MKIVIALDDSPYSHHVLDLVCRRHWPQDTEFKILHVVEPLEVTDWIGEEWPEMQVEIGRRRERHAEKFCADARHRIEKHFPDSRVHFEVRFGNPKREIVLAATEWEANRILIGAHGHDVCPHNLIGSVSRSVAEQAPCTVEIIRTGLPAHRKTEHQTTKKPETASAAGKQS